MAFVEELINDTSIPWIERQDAISRIYFGPGIPTKGTHSFWMNKPHPELHNTQSAELSPTADIVIIGSGITGASVAQALLGLQHDDVHGASKPVDDQYPKIVMLEARDICSGATGRNGGHCLETVEDYLTLKEKLGSVAARNMVRFRLRHLRCFLDVAETLGIASEAQVRKVQFLSAHFDQRTWQHVKASIESFKADMPEESKEWGIISDPALIKEHRIAGAVGIIHGPAGALWPYKFVTAVLAKLKSRHEGRFMLEANTTALRVDRANGSYQVLTSRGTIQCKHVVHCTNAHVSHLVPDLLGRVYPLRGQMSAQAAPSNLPNQHSKHSWLFNYGAGFDYLTQLPTVPGTCDGEMMFGGGFVNSAYHGLREVAESKDDKDDVDTGIHLAGTLRKVFQTAQDDHSHGTHVKAMWTGTMGFSADGLPWVGELPSPSSSELEQGSRQWVAAGFSGEGMVHAWLCGEAVGRMILGFEEGQLDTVKQEISEWFPTEMVVTGNRLSKARMPKMAPTKTL